MNNGGSGMKRRNPAICLFLIVASCLVAQDAATGVPVLPRILLCTARPAGSQFTQGDAVMISRSLLQRLQEAAKELVPVEYSPDTNGQSIEQLGSTARTSGTDGWIQVTLSGGWNAVRFAIRGYDLSSGAVVLEITRERSGWGSPAGLVREGWDDVVQAVAGKFHMPQRPAIADASVPLARLTVNALPGSTLTGLGKNPVRIESEGSASMELPAFQEYVLRTSLAGFIPVTQRFFLSTDRQIAVEQSRESQWGLQVALLDGRAPGADVTMAFPAQSLFLRLGFSTYVAALTLSDTDIFVSQPLTNLHLQAGWYMSAPDRFARFYLGLGGFLRIVHASGSPLTLDAISPFGLHATVGAELSVFSKGRIYLEYTPTIFQTDMPDVFHAALGQDIGPGWIFGKREVMNLVSFSFGYRWQL
jgi:hypothetical protein